MSFLRAQPDCSESRRGGRLDMFIDHRRLYLQTLYCLEAICPPGSLPSFALEAALCHFTGTVR